MLSSQHYECCVIECKLVSDVDGRHSSQYWDVGLLSLRPESVCRHPASFGRTIRSAADDDKHTKRQQGQINVYIIITLIWEKVIKNYAIVIKQVQQSVNWRHTYPLHLS